MQGDTETQGLCGKAGTAKEINLYRTVFNNTDKKISKNKNVAYSKERRKMQKWMRSVLLQKMHFCLTVEGES